MITNKDIVVQARKYLGIKYKHQGRNEYGLDCLGLVVRVAHDLGLSKDDSTDYGKIPDGKRLMREIELRLDKVVDYQEGDLLLMSFDSNPQHLAIVTDQGIIHSYALAKKVVEHRLDEFWKQKIVRAYRFRGLN
jgi:cell wall-associated NlpC family hydrolase